MSERYKLMGKKILILKVQHAHHTWNVSARVANARELRLIKKIITILIVILCACNRECDIREKLLTNCSHKYWDVKYVKDDYFIGAYRFDIDGSCYYLKYNRGEHFVRKFFSDAHYRPSHIWNFIGKDSIEVLSYGFYYQIKEFSNDTIILLHTSDSSLNEMLIVSKDQKDNYNFDKLKKETNTEYRFNKKHFRNH
ncbi:MAG: hypothetical protein K1X81_07580 [Bacteroidia bacterium]|nr:hypothetical protein [Bacteroidia bacterium]